MTSSSTSKTGLISSPIKKINRINCKERNIQLKAITRPAPYILKPFAGLFNPYPYGCSLLCNHPTDNEAKQLLRKAKTTWANEGKNLLLSEEIEAIRASLERFKLNEQQKFPSNHLPLIVESVPEELFRRYTETDSRPLTPAPTLASAATRASGSRRCFTPDPIPTTKIHEKTMLILDLRRSHSQETLSWYGSSLLEPPLIRIQRVPTRTTSYEDLNESNCTVKSKSPSYLNSPSPLSKRPKSSRKYTNKINEIDNNIITDNNSQLKPELNDSINEDEFIKRRGKGRRKRGRDASRGPPAIQNFIDPETQVGTIGNESHNPSSRPSLIPAVGGGSGTIVEDNSVADKRSRKYSKSFDIDSYLDIEILKQLRRELNEEIVDNEFNFKRRKALEEALKTITKDRRDCDELMKLQKELNLAPVNTELWLSLPRVFSRSSARFEMPMDSRILEKLTPLDYLKDYVSISSPRKLLYNCIFNKFKVEGNNNRRISGENLQDALDLMMGKSMNNKQSETFREIINWSDGVLYDFQTFCGICAVCERLLAPEYLIELPDRINDPCHEIEIADFESLERKIDGRTVNGQLIKMLNGIKNS